MTRRMRMESSVAPRAECTAPWLFFVRRFMRRPRFQPSSDLPGSGRVREY
jgi:hypothetical protein